MKDGSVSAFELLTFLADGHSGDLATALADEESGIATGFADLDRLLGGLQPGRLTVVASHSGLGTSTFCLDLVRSAAIRQEAPSLLLSFDSSAIEVAQRLVAAEARVPIHIIRSGGASEDVQRRMREFTARLADMPLFIDSRSEPDLDYVQRAVRDAVEAHRVRLVVVDGLRNIGPDLHHDGRETAVKEIVGTLRRLAVENSMAVVLATDLVHPNTDRHNFVPGLWDLKYGYVVEEAASVVILLHRDDYYDRESPRAGECDLVVAKNRNGPTDTIVVAAQLHMARFVDMAV